MSLKKPYAVAGYELSHKERTLHELLNTTNMKLRNKTFVWTGKLRNILKLKASTVVSATTYQKKRRL